MSANTAGQRQNGSTVGSRSADGSTTQLDDHSLPVWIVPELLAEPHRVASPAMFDYSRIRSYHIACGYTDMRKQIDGPCAGAVRGNDQRKQHTSVLRQAFRQDQGVDTDIKGAFAVDRPWQRYKKHEASTTCRGAGAGNDLLLL